MTGELEIPQQFIVAEISKAWDDKTRAQYNIGAGLLLAQMFEHVINHNAARYYMLHSFQLHRILVRKDELNETIIAVFEYNPPQLTIAEPDK